MNEMIRAGETYMRGVTATIELPDADALEASGRVDSDTPGVRATAPNGDPYHLRVVMSTEDVATDGGIIKADGWKLDRFQRNPVFLWSHDYGEPAIGRVVHVEAKGKRLIGWVLFDEDDEFAARIRSKYERGFMRAVSVGFRPLKLRSTWRDELTDAEQKKNAVWVSDETELLELSAVSVPADSKALKYSHKPEDAREDAAESTGDDTEDRVEETQASETSQGSDATVEPDVAADEAEADEAEVEAADPAEATNPAEGADDAVEESDADAEEIERLATIEVLALQKARKLIRSR